MLAANHTRKIAVVAPRAEAVALLNAGMRRYGISAVLAHNIAFKEAIARCRAYVQMGR
jgi:hypothetical protein